MDTTPTTRWSDQSRQDPRPDDPDFIAACMATVDSAAALRARAPSELMPAASPAAYEPVAYAPPAYAPPAYEPPARSEVDPHQQPISALTAERDVAVSDLQEIRRREAQARADLQSLWAEFDSIKRQHDDKATKLEVAAQRDVQLRAQLDEAMTAIANYDRTIDDLRHVVAGQDREIEGLRQRLLETEEARAADVTAILESLQQHKS